MGKCEDHNRGNFSVPELSAVENGSSWSTFFHVTITIAGIRSIVKRPCFNLLAVSHVNLPYKTYE